MVRQMTGGKRVGTSLGVGGGPIIYKIQRLRLTHSKEFNRRDWPGTLLVTKRSGSESTNLVGPARSP